MTGVWWGNLGVRDHLEYLDVSRRIILKWTVKKLDGAARTGLIWLRLWKGGRLCRMRE
jgi:hypothetical protein